MHRISGLFGMQMLNCFSQTDGTEKCMRVLIDPHPMQHFLLLHSFFFVLYKYKMEFYFGSNGNFRN